MPITDALLPEFDHEIGTTRKLLDRVPDAKLGWKPHDKSMSLGELASHITNIPLWAGRILTMSAIDLATAPPPPPPRGSRSEIVSAFDANTQQARGALVGKSDAEMMAIWTLTRGDQQVFSVPRAGAFRSFIMNHLIHHRGQLSVYLRLLDVAIPSIYGPSADER